METKSKVVIDTSLIVRSFISPKSYSAEIIQNWYLNKFILLMSSEAYNEAQEVLQRSHFSKYHFHKGRIRIFLKTITSKCSFVEPVPIAIQSRDSKDTKFLHLALAGAADYLVSGDNDLLVLKDHPDIGNLKIVNEKDFIEALSA